MKTTTFARDNVDFSCPKCGKILDATTSLVNQVPEPEDISICFYCFAILEFAEDGSSKLADKKVVKSMEKKLSYIKKLLLDVKGN